MSGCHRVGPLLDGYHDRELRLLARWRVGRHLDRCPACREELAGLARLGDRMREAPSTGPDPDLWSEVAACLPRAAPATVRVRWRVPRLAPIASATLVAGAVAAFWLAPPGLFSPVESTSGSGVVQSINAHGQPVMVFDEPDDATIIWLMDDPGREGSEEVASVWI